MLTCGTYESRGIRVLRLSGVEFFGGAHQGAVAVARLYPLQERGFRYLPDSCAASQTGESPHNKVCPVFVILSAAKGLPHKDASL